MKIERDYSYISLNPKSHPRTEALDLFNLKSFYYG